MYLFFFKEHHLQRAICTGLIIPTPEVLETDHIFYDRNYPADYKMTRQLIHMQRNFFFLQFTNNHKYIEF